MDIDSSALQAASRGFSPRDFLMVVFRRRGLVLAFFLGVVAVAITAGIVKPPTYKASASLLVKKGRAEVPVAAKEAPAMVMHRVTEQDLNSEVEILRSRWLIEDTIDTLESEGVDIDELAGAGSLSYKIKAAIRKVTGPDVEPRDFVVVHLLEYVKVDPIGKSNLIRVSYRSKNPEWATRLVRTLTQQYLERRAEVFQSGQTESFFEEQMLAAKGRLEEAESELEVFLGEYGITMVSGPEGAGPLAAQKNVTLERLAELETQFSEAQAGLREREKKVQGLQERLAKEDERVPSANAMYQDSSIAELEKALVSLKLKRDELQQDFSSSGRFIRDIDAQIAMAEARLQQAEERTGGINRTEVNPVHVSLKTELLLAQTELEGYRARYYSARDQLANEQGKLGALNEKGFTVERLMLDAKTAREAYLLYEKKHEEARISSAMDREKIVNVSIAEPALKPLKPTGVSRKLTVLLAMVMGLFGGLGVAFVRDFFDHSFVTGEDIERQLGVTHLGSIPDDRDRTYKKVAGL